MVCRRAYVFALAAAVVAWTWAQPKRLLVVMGRSMAPTYASGEVLWTVPVDRPLRRGDVVVADTPTGTVVKRVALLGGDYRLQWLSAGQWIDTTLLHIPRAAKSFRRTRTVLVPKGTVFLLGDNLEASVDSRNYGSVAVDRVRRLVVDDRTPSERSWLAMDAPREWLAYGVRKLSAEG